MLELPSDGVEVASAQADSFQEVAGRSPLRSPYSRRHEVQRANATHAYTVTTDRIPIKNHKRQVSLKTWRNLTIIFCVSTL
jgi:hypothetical protein